MPNKKKQIDRRKYKRFRVIDDTFVLLGSSNHQKCLIINISLGGLSFRYYAGTTEIKEFSPTDTGKLDIIRATENLRIRQIPFETVYDIEFENEISMHSFRTRKRGVRFTRLTRQHRSQLEQFIKEHTIKLSKEYDSEEF
jgi:hypothetical protein